MIQNDEIVQRILEVLPDNINLIIIFGSRARGNHSEESDLDIAISTTISDKRRRFKLKLKFISQLEGPNQDVDVVIVEDANWSLNYRIASEGVVLYQNDEDSWANFVERVMIYYPDYRVFEQKILKETLERI